MNGSGIEIRRVAGQVVEVGGILVKSVMLPDWNLDYIDVSLIPIDKHVLYRTAIHRLGNTKIVKVTRHRIYFEQS